MVICSFELLEIPGAIVSEVIQTYDSTLPQDFLPYLLDTVDKDLLILIFGS